MVKSSSRPKCLPLERSGVRRSDPILPHIAGIPSTPFALIERYLFEREKENLRHISRYELLPQYYRLCPVWPTQQQQSTTLDSGAVKAAIITSIATIITALITSR
jgi:hypothetical protein